MRWAFVVAFGLSMFAAASGQIVFLPEGGSKARIIA